MEFRILGSLEAWHDEGRVELPGSKPRALLAILLLNPNETLSTDRLVDALWGERPPATAAKALQVHVSRLRKALAGSDGAGAAVLTGDHGYQLRLDPERLDAHRFERLVAEGRGELAADRAPRAVAVLEEALVLWRGQPLSDLGYAPFAQREIARLDDLRVDALEDLIEAKLALGAHAEVVGRLEALIAENPHRERLRAHLMVALYRCERQADALQAYRDARRTLVDELGIEPGERLRELEQAILAQDRSLARPRVERLPDAHADGASAATGGTAVERPVAGREAELAAIDEVLAAAREGLRSLAIEGEPGIGKTTLWREALARGARYGHAVLSCRPAQAEKRLSFAGLADLLAPVDPDALAPLPAPQRHALEVALLRAEADEPGLDPRAIGTGLVSLLSGLAARGPLLLAIDDVQWLDRPTARALEFALRRLESAQLSVLVTVRPKEPGYSAGLLAAVAAERTRRTRLGPLDVGALYEILQEHLDRPLTRPLLASIERASRGNPFYALELARALDSSGPLRPGEALPVPDDMREVVATRLRALPESTRAELLKASALAQPTVELVDAAELAPALEAGIVTVHQEGRVEFSHPLFAAAVHSAASPVARRLLHAELAGVVTDVEERAWHLSLGTDGPDEGVARALDAAAELAHRRGAPTAAAELAERAAQTTPQAEPARWERSLRAACHHYRAGDAGRARALAEDILAASPSPPVRVKTLHLLAEQRWWMEHFESAIPLLEEALELVGDDTGQAAQLEQSLGLCLGGIADFAGADVHFRRSVELAEAAGENGLLAEAVALKAHVGLVSGKGLDEEACERALALEDPDREVPFQVRPSLNVAQSYQFVGRPDAARELLLRLRDRIVVRGEESDLPFVLVQLSGAATLSGDLEVAEAEACDALRVATLTGQDFFRAFAHVVRGFARAIRGDGDEARADAAEALAIAERIGWPWGIHMARWDQALVELSEDEPEAAATALEPVLPAIEAIGVYEWPLAHPVPEGIEALVATGDLDRARRLADALAEWGRRFDRPWALALGARSHALLHAAAGELDQAEEAAERALVDHERLPYPFERARTLLVLGQIQRRRGQRRAARTSLEQALAIFEEIGARRWADKARDARRRIGVRRAPDELSETERRVAELATEGLTNREIAAQLFMSRRTVEANLARAYRKLGIRSRAELGATMARRGGVSAR